MRIGIPRGLMFNDFSPLFIPFFDYLGIETVISDETKRRIIDRGLERVPAQYCFPIKVAFGHMDNVLEKNIDYVFVPSILNTGKPTGCYKYSVSCPWIQSAPDVMRATFSLENLISPTLNFDWGKRHVEMQMKKAVAQMGLSTKHVRDALHEGLQKKKEFDELIEQKAKAVFDSIPKDEIAFLVMARPYTAYDTNANNDIAAKILEAGYLAIPIEFAPIGPIDISKELPNMYWVQGQKKLAAIELLNQNPNLFGIDITYFACGPDTQISQQMRFRTQKPYLSIEMDEHTGDAGIDTRLHAFFNTVKSYLERGVSQIEKKYSVKIKTFGETKGKKILWPPMSDHVEAVAASFNAAGIPSEVLELNPDDSLELARRQTFGLVCTPYLHTTDAMLYAAKKPDFNPNDVAFFQAMSKCGPCRLGQYATLESLVFQKMGLDVDIIMGGNLGGELSIGLPLLIKAWAGASAVDQLEKMRMHTRPYEAVEGTSDKIYESYKKELLGYLENSKTNLGKFKSYISIASPLYSWARTKLIPPIEDILREAQEEFSEVERTNDKRPLIGIVGEFFVRLHPAANQNIVRKLEAKGAETWLAPMTEYLAYSYYIDSVFARERFMLGREKQDLKEWIGKWWFYKMMIDFEHSLFRATLPYMQGFDDVPPERVVRDGSRYIRHYIGGEAILSMGKAEDYVRRGLDGVVSVIPFNCMPGLIVAGLIPQFRREHGNIPFISIEYDGYRDNTREVRIDTFVAQVNEIYQNKKVGKL